MERRALLLFASLLAVASLLLYKLGGYLTDSPERLLAQNWLSLTDAGFLPYRDFWVEQPPLLALWHWSAYRASLLLPPWIDSRLWSALAAGLLPLTGTLATLWLASRQLSPPRLAVLGANFGLLAFTVASDGPLLLACFVSWLAAVQRGRWALATALAAGSALLAPPLLVLVHLGATVAAGRARWGGTALFLVAAGWLAWWRMGGMVGSSALAWLGTGGSLLFTASERRLDPTLVPTPDGQWLLPLALGMGALVLARWRQPTLADTVALLVTSVGLIGPLASPTTMLLLAVLPLLTLPLLLATLWSALLGGSAAAILASTPADRGPFLALGAAVAVAYLACRLRAPRVQLAEDREAAVQVVALLALRLPALVLLRPFGYFGEWNDFHFFLGWAQLAERGLLPFRDFWMEHPPVFPALVVLAYQFARVLPPPPDEHLWFNLALGLLTLPAEVASLLASRRLCTQLGRPGAARLVGWLFILSFPALFFWTAGFDGLVVALTLLALSAARAQRPAWAGLWLGLGTATKLFPLALLPALLAGSPPRARWRLLGSCALTLGAVLLPVVVANPRLAAASAASLTTRGSWETVWALVDGYYRGGELPPPAVRTDPTTVATTARPARLPWLPFALLAALGYLALLLRARRTLTPPRTAAWAAAGLLGLLLISKGWSPQFVVYPLALGFVLLPLERALPLATNLIAATLFEYPLALLLLDNEPLPLAVAVLWRTGTLAVLVADLLATGLGLAGSPAALLRRPLTLTPALLVPLGLGALVFYRALWLEPGSAEQQLISAASSQRAGVIAPNEETYRQLAPYLPAVLRPVAGRLAGEAIGHSPRWLLATTAPAGDVAAAAAALRPFAFPLGLLTGAPAEQFQTARDRWQPVGLTFGEWQLVAVSVERAEREDAALALVATSWQGGAAPAELRLFLHAVGEDGRPLAQQDGPPTFPLDRRTVQLPLGSQGLRLGLYEAGSGARLRSPTGQEFLALPLPTQVDASQEQR
jgi:hypothetical protein